MAGQIITTQFTLGDKAYVLSKARNEGLLTWGIISEIVATVGRDGTVVPVIAYGMQNASAMAPPGGLWAEWELTIEATAKSEASAYHNRMAGYHEEQRDRP